MSSSCRARTWDTLQMSFWCNSWVPCPSCGIETDLSSPFISPLNLNLMTSHTMCTQRALEIRSKLYEILSKKISWLPSGNFLKALHVWALVSNLHSRESRECCIINRSSADDVVGRNFIDLRVNSVRVNERSDWNKLMQRSEMRLEESYLKNNGTKKEFAQLIK